ncbi:DUF3857 domain-containing protein [Cecembia lonarensis]|uniref:Uncharacterized protein n=1 Tax=Cecembia lonarensis (strain CCUG 58316 / KCTC 22772 / LW9) TaxID=1225176 RepID=K1LB43_CECL9|nr:DUF3857 domain-containing protein [Cecembia lonarensis]EKB49492.1 hypothetical protein B879_01889 [Cecembia lonarensis LW9]
MKNRHLIPFLMGMLLFPSFANTQVMKFGKYSQEEINLKKIDFEPDANAVVLEEISRNQFMGTVQHTDVHRRVKVLKEPGKNQGNVSIRYYFGKAGIQDVSKLNAQTVNFVNGEEQVIKLSKADFFQVELDNGWREVRFTFPSVEVGSILEYSYHKTDKSIAFLESWVFHNPIPTIKSTYTIDLPSYLNYRFLAQGEKTLNTPFKGQRDGFYSWTVKDLPSIKEEPMMSNYRDYLEKIDFQLAGYAFVNTSEYGGRSGFQETFATWQDLTRFFTELEEFAQYMKPNASLKGQLATLNVSGSSETQIAREVYEYILSNYTYSGQGGYFPKKNLKSVLDSKKGSRAEINLTLMAYLRQNGISANPLLISTKGNGRSRLVDTPFIDQFDQMIIHLKADGKDYYLDATSNSFPFGYLPLNMHVAYGYLMHDQNSGLVPINISHRSGMLQMSQIRKEDNGNFVSSSTVRFSEYDALEKRNGINLSEDKKIKEEWFGSQEINVYDFTLIEKTEPRLQLEAKYNYSEGKVTESPMILISPFHLMRWAENPFKSEYRTFPVDFSYAFNDSYTTIIEIPEAYELDDYPENTEVAIPGGDGLFTYQLTTLDNSVKISANVTLKYPLISPFIYPELKYFMEIVTGKLTEPVIIKLKAKP